MSAHLPMCNSWKYKQGLSGALLLLNNVLLSLIHGHALCSSCPRRPVLSIFNVIPIYQCAVLFPFQGGCISAMTVTWMEVSVEALRRKGHRVVTGEKVVQVGYGFPFPWSSCLKLCFESKAHWLNHNFLALSTVIPGEMWFRAKVFDIVLPTVCVLLSCSSWTCIIWKERCVFVV
jgi:hypothetical protein